MSKKHKYTNISNGESDGIIFFYMRNKMMYPILISEEQAQMLDIAIAIPFKESNLKISPTPVEYEAIKHMIIE